MIIINKGLTIGVIFILNIISQRRKGTGERIEMKTVFLFLLLCLSASVRGLLKLRAFYWM